MWMVNKAYGGSTGSFFDGSMPKQFYIGCSVYC